MSPLDFLRTPLRAVRWLLSRAPAPRARRALGANDVLRLPGGPGRSVRIEAGAVVVTRAGDPVDHVLGPGAELGLPDRTLALAWALEDSVLELRSARPIRAPGRPVTPPARRPRTWSMP